MDTARSERFSQRLVAVSLIASMSLHTITVVPEYKIPKVYVPQKHMEKKVLYRAKKVINTKRVKVMKGFNGVPVRYTSSQVAGYIVAALRITHEPKSWSRPLFWLAYQESRFYTRAIDGTSVRNANLAGKTEHAVGLFQVLPSTFQRHAVKGLGDIWNPVDNAVSAIRYIEGRYESPYRIPGMFQVSQYCGY